MNIRQVSIVLAGPTNVGKSSILHLLKERADSHDLLPTVEVETWYHEIIIGDAKYNLKITDSAGQKRFQRRSLTHFKEAQVVLFFYAVADLQSIQEAVDLYNQQLMVVAAADDHKYSQIKRQQHHFVGTTLDDSIELLNLPAHLDGVLQGKNHCNQNDNCLVCKLSSRDDAFMLFKTVSKGFFDSTSSVLTRRATRFLSKKQTKVLDFEKQILQISKLNQLGGSSDQHDFYLKIVMLGHQKTGKSSLHSRYFESDYQQYYCPTLGVDYKMRLVHCRGKDGQIQIWDTSGDLEFRLILQSYLLDADGFILVYDIACRSTFEELKLWIELVSHLPSRHCGILVGNKCDLAHRRQVGFEEGQAIAEQYKWEFLETSALQHLNVDEAFTRLINSIIKID